MLYRVLAFLLFAFVSGWSACVPATYNNKCSGGNISCNFCPDVNINVSASVSGQGVQYGSCQCDQRYGTVQMLCGGSSAYFVVQSSTYHRSCCGSNYGAESTFSGLLCDSRCSRDSVVCLDTLGVWDSSNCLCRNPNSHDTTYHCQNAGGPEDGGFGGPRVAKLFLCVDGSCRNTRDLSGTCQDWGFCSDGVDDCDIPCGGSVQCPPCGRAGSGFTSSTRCYYSCADGTDLSCKPTSTQYVAGAINVGTCPDNPPSDCRPGSSSGASSSASSSPSSSPSPTSSFSRDTVKVGDDWEIDYNAILQAIHDTLHHANVQRDFQNDLQVAANNSFDIIANFSQYNYGKLDGINTASKSIDNTLKGWNDNGFSLVSETENDISEARRLLDEINNYLRSDSLLRGSVDTSYNPALRDIKAAIDSISVDVTVNGDSSAYVRDTAFHKWFMDYYADSASSRGFIGKVYDAVLKNFGRDSVKSSNCAAVFDCIREHGDMGYCKNLYGVGAVGDCMDGGTPIDGIVNAEVGILDLLFKAFFGGNEADTVNLTTTPPDTSWTPPAVADSANSDVRGALSAIPSKESLDSLVNSLNAKKDSLLQKQKDTVKVQPDSLWRDSSQIAPYVQNLLLPPGTSNTCFVCHAELGNFGGFLKDNLSIHIDFANFGGFNFCAIMRAVVRIMTFVICMSLTLGSWAAAFGYNPKNDA